ncbi:MAG: zinc ribbon domain-containing protein [Gemmatimonadota bacterium]|nr:MAG: zinc ribbon domain-containing protein [Gemmatimonadota bacterium]
MNQKNAEKPAADRLRCSNCGSERAAADKFCRNCGAPLRVQAKPNGKIRGLSGLQGFGLALIAFAFGYALRHYGGDLSQRPEPPAQSISITEVGALPSAAPSPASPRATADALFNQAMMAQETGDTAAAAQFTPMAVSAYRGLSTLDLDGRYHVALLNMAAGQPQEALSEARTMLSEVPNHLLALSASAQAHLALGNTDSATFYYRRFLEEYTPEVAASRPEYLDHGRTLPRRRDEARRFLQERGLRPDND